jgi:hypothetical protein
MASRLSASERDVRALAGVVSAIRSELPTQGLPLSLLSDLKDQIPCDFLLCHGYDTTLQQYWFTQQIPQDNGEEGPADEGFNRVFWEQYWDCQVCSYPDRTGDLWSIVKVYDFYGSRAGARIQACQVWSPSHSATSTPTEAAVSWRV